MKIKEYIEQLKTLQENIKGCDNLIEFYRAKKNNRYKLNMKNY